MVCLNPRLRKQRARKREDLLAETERVLSEIARAAARRRPGPNNRDRIHTAIGNKANCWKVRRHFEIEVCDDGMTWSRNQASINAEARLDGIYVIRTSLTCEDIDAEQTVEAYKRLARIERAFRCIKTTRLEVRPTFVYNENRVRAHVFLCMLAWYLEWHMRRCLAPLLLEDSERQGTQAKRTSPVAKAERSDSAKANAQRKRTPDGLPVHSMTSLLADLATLTLNEVTLPGQDDSAFLMTAKPTALQRRAFELLGVRNETRVYSNLTG